AEAPAREDNEERVWGSGRRSEARQGVVERLCDLGARIDEGATPRADALCLVLPLGSDATTAALDEGLDPKRSLALDTFLDSGRQWTLMTTPVTESAWREAARTLLSAGD